jgi:methyl-accepting chemotaxis protein
MLAKVFESHTEQMTLLKEAISHSYKLNADVLVLRKNEKNFLTRLSWDEIKKFQTNTVVLKNDVDRLSEILGDKSHLQESLTKIHRELQLYKDSFSVVSKQYEKIGIDYDHGLKGRVKQAFLKIEAFIWQIENEEFSFRDLLEPYHHQLLKISVNEKNFLLKPAQKYVDRFKTHVNFLYEMLESEHFLTEEHKSWLSDLINEYAHAFYELSTMILELDHPPDSPLITLSHAAKEMEIIVHQISSKIVDEIIVSERGAKTYSTLIMLSFAFGLLSIALVPFLLLMTSTQQSLILIDDKG